MPSLDNLERAETTKMHRVEFVTMHAFCFLSGASGVPAHGLPRPGHWRGVSAAGPRAPEQVRPDLQDPAAGTGRWNRGIGAAEQQQQQRREWRVIKVTAGHRAAPRIARP